MKKARYFKKMKGKDGAGDLVECTACEHRCKIAEGNSGICGVRKNIDGDLYSLVYGRATDAYADFIEKKKLAHFLPGSKAFSIGTVGCNFSCVFCINWQVSQYPKIMKEERKLGAKMADIEELGYELTPEEIVDYCVKKDYPIIAYTYNEPTVFVEYALDTARLAAKQGIKNVFVTNCFMSEDVLPEIIDAMDAVAVDMKSIDDKFYRKLCKGTVDPVLRNIREIQKSGTWIELTTLIIPGENDSDAELKKLAEFISGMSDDIPWHIIQFTPQYKMQDKPRTPPETLDRAYQIGKGEGLKYVYYGNLWDSDRTSTYCPKCGELLIFRDVYDIKVQEIFEGGKCKGCGEKIAGVWK